MSTARGKSLTLNGLVILALLILSAPTLVVLGASFTAGNLITFPPDGFSLKWYAKVFAASDLRQAFFRSLQVAVICTLIGVASVPLGWASLEGSAFALLIGAGLLGGMGHVLMTEAVARAPVSLLAGYEYTGIIWAFAFDFALLGIALDAWAISGAVVIVAAAALVAYGQGKFSQPALAAQTGK